MKRQIPAHYRAPHVPLAVTALMAALQVGEPDGGPLQRLEDREWNALLSFCDRAHLSLALAQLDTSRFPTWVSERLKINVADNARRFERVKETYREAADALSRAHVDHIIIKGFTQAPAYVLDPKLRAQSDLDLYCPREMIDPARMALQTIGYKPNEEVDYFRADHVPTMVRQGNWQWRGNPFDPDMPLSIELHFCLWNENASLFSVPGVERFWGRRLTRSLDGLSFPCLNPVDHLGYLSLHILRGLMWSDWIIHHVRELANFLHAQAADDAFWLAWSEAHEPALQALQGLAFYYARAWFGCDLNPRAERAISNLSPAQQRWIHRFGGSPLDGMFHENRDSVWLHLTFLRSARAKLVVMKRAFLPHRVPRSDAPRRYDYLQPQEWSGPRARGQQAAFLASRVVSYSYSRLVTIFRGLGWQLSRHQPARPSNNSQ